MNTRLLACGLLLATAPVVLHAAGAPPCATPEYRQFDFWLGLWHVTGPKGGFAGINRIERVHSGCALRENWSAGRGGYTGSSLNWFGADGRWHQTWVDSSGQTLELAGGVDQQGAMVMSGRTPNAKSPDRFDLQRITWSQLGPASVRQLWETSNDDGKTWSIAFDGKYQRIGLAEPAGELTGAAFFSRAAGAWIGAGTIQGAKVSVTLTLQPLLANKAWELRWHNLGSGDGQGAFEGRAMYQLTNAGEAQGQWWDSGGGRFELRGTLSEAMLTVLWGNGRTVYQLKSADELEVVDSIRANSSEWREFGRSLLKRQ